MNAYAKTLAAFIAVVFVSLAALAATGTAAAADRSTIAADSSLERSLFAELNKVRAAHGLRPLAASPGLTRAADAHAKSMAVRGFFSHDSADGTPFNRRIARYFGLGKARSWVVGENILYQPQSAGADAAVAGWMASPAHRANILAKDYKLIGISAMRVSLAPGVFGGLDVTILVTDFGARS
jgi:uncharacterized protein YkwD